MSDVGSITEANELLAKVQQDIRDAGVEAGGVLEFLQRLHANAAAVGMEGSAEVAASAEQSLEEWQEEAEGLASSVDDLMQRIESLRERH